MIFLLAWRNVTDRPWRAFLLLLGYGIGVSVMISLLSVGEALVTQAREEKLVGGGSVTVLPDGIDLEVLKTGGLGGMFFSVPNARFVYSQVLASPRNAGVIAAVAPQMDNKLLYLSAPGHADIPVRAIGELPDATKAVGAQPPIASGEWQNDAADDRWSNPTLAELRHDIDRFHLPPAGIANRETWGEWHYFNVLSDDAERWAFISFIVGGDLPDGTEASDNESARDWGGQVLVTLHERGKPARRFSASAPSADVRFSTQDADVRIGSATVTVREDGAYIVRGSATEEGRGTPLSLDLVVTPAANAFFPGASLVSGDFVSGYTVPGLRASATGQLCVGAAITPAGAAPNTGCEQFTEARAYHDHNWGAWRGVTWEWGAARAGTSALLFGRVQPPDSLQAESPLFVYVTDSLGFVALFRPRVIMWEDTRTTLVDGRIIRVPGRGLLEDIRGDDTIRVELLVDDAVATDTRVGLIDRGETALARELQRPYFVQMQGRIRLTLTVRGERTAADGTGFFETYR